MGQKATIGIALTQLTDTHTGILATLALIPILLRCPFDPLCFIYSDVEAKDMSTEQNVQEVNKRFKGVRRGKREQPNTVSSVYSVHSRGSKAVFAFTGRACAADGEVETALKAIMFTENTRTY